MTWLGPGSKDSAEPRKARYVLADPREPTLNPTMDLHDDITRCHGRICKRILAIHIYRMATLLGADLAVQFVCFELVLSLLDTDILLTPSCYSCSFPLSFDASIVHPVLSVVTDVLFCVQSALVEIEGGKGRRGIQEVEKESFVHGRTSVTRKNICVIIY